RLLRGRGARGRGAFDLRPPVDDAPWRVDNRPAGGGRIHSPMRRRHRRHRTWRRRPARPRRRRTRPAHGGHCRARKPRRRAAMTAHEFLGLRPTDDPARWRMPIAARVLTHAGAVQGGAEFAAAVETMEAVTERPLVWAAAQFLRHAGPGGTLDVD